MKSVAQASSHSFQL